MLEENNFSPFENETKQTEIQEPFLPESGNIEQDTQQPNQNVDPQDPNGKRFSYFQSLADQYKNELESIKPYLPIVEYIKENPSIIDQIQNANVQEQPKLEKPIMPTKPANYDPNDFDPSSESFKYRQAYEDYLLKMNEYVLTKQEQLENYLSSVEEEKQAQAKKNMVINNMAEYLQRVHKYTPSEVQNFIQTYSDPRSLTLDNLVMLDKLRRNNFKQQKFDNPSPAGVFGSFNTQQASPDEAFNASLAKMSWKNNPELMRRAKK